MATITLKAGIITHKVGITIITLKVGIIQATTHRDGTTIIIFHKAGIQIIIIHKVGTTIQPIIHKEIQAIIPKGGIPIVTQMHGITMLRAQITTIVAIGETIRQIKDGTLKIIYKEIIYKESTPIIIIKDGILIIIIPKDGTRILIILKDGITKLRDGVITISNNLIILIINQILAI